jgi:AcrR family transcriptional regulator
MPKKRYHHGNLRLALIEAADNILASSGIEGLSLRKVAQRTGVSATALYSHFADKRELLAELATRGFEQLSVSMSEQGKARGAGESEMVGLARGYVLFAINHPALFRLMFGSGIDDLLEFPALVSAGSKSYAMMTDSLAREIADNGSTTSVSVSGTAAWSMVHGLATLINDGRVTPHTCGVESIDEMITQVSGMLIGCQCTGSTGSS